VLLKSATWPEVEEYLRKRNDVVVPVGSTEQHGPSGPCGTDTIVAEELARELHEDRRAMVAPTLEVSVSTAHLGFPGTIAVRPMTMMALMRDALTSLAQHGFRRFLVLNAHPGSASTLDAVAAQFHADQPDARCVVHNWWELPEVKAMLLEFYGAREGHHATPGELSIVKKFYPRGVPDTPPPEKFEAVAQPQIFSAADFKKRYPDGRIGSDPSLATSGAGDRIFLAASRALNEAHKRLLDMP
jgi:creatinine amidohydrolase